MRAGSASLLASLLFGCLARPSEVTPTPVAAPERLVTPQVAAPPEHEVGCVPEGGDMTRCCPSRLGFDPALALARCGWSSYLGEHAELACVHAFTSATGERVEVFVASLVQLELARALELHVAGLGEHAPPLERWTDAAGGELITSEHEGFAWAFVAGWASPRRVAWSTAQCELGPMLEVVRAMSRSAPEASGEQPWPPFEIDVDARAQRTGLLAHTHESSDPAALRLPDDAPRVAAALLDALARDDLDAYLALLAPSARWGLPDRRQLGGRAIGSTPDTARTSFVALAHAAARLPSGSEVRCPVPSRRMRQPLQRGEHLQWCFWISDDGLDVLTLALRSHAGVAKLEYLGLFPGRPDALLEVRGEPPPPPPTPVAPLECGDPHARDTRRCAPPPDAEPVDAAK
jgi:hypothetical protein